LLACLPLAACDDDDMRYRCANGHCYCAGDNDCQIPCAAPPCHIECVGEEVSCTAECGNGSCLCGEGSECAFGCQSPPCHVRCEPGASCTGECANGSCTCERGASCTFDCQSGPCHVRCVGDNPLCKGTCANGSCACGPASTCHFSCMDGNCSASCDRGSSCVLECPSGRAGERGCDFQTCAGGTTVCPSGDVVTCNAPCP
jgi:hypothetical protein